MTRNFSPNSFRQGGGSRRRAALAGSSLAGLMLLAAAAPASAETDVTGARTTPIATATAASGAPDNVVVDSGASVEPGSGVAVTLNSNNTVTNSGTIQIQNQDNTTGILVLGGNTGSVTNIGTITINETNTPTTTNSQGAIGGPFAVGSNRYGIRVTGTDPFIGPITNSGTITVQGNDSAAISVETNLQGLLYSGGAVAATGTNAVGIRTLGVSEGINVTGTIAAVGQGAQALAVGGDVGGQVLIQSALTSTGYRYPTLSTNTTFNSSLGADDLLQGGPTVSIAGNVAQGVLIDTAGSVISSAAAPGLVIGAVGKDITLGDVGTSTDAFGLEIRGVVEGLGVYSGVTATGLQLGVANGGQVFTTGGVHVSGSITAAALEANTTAVLLNSGVNVPLFQNDGLITSTATATGAVTAYGLVINPGANVTTFANSSSLSANILGSAGSAVALIDKSGTLTSIQNIRTISAGIFPTVTGTAITGTATAIDVSANTTGVNLLQFDTSGGLTPPSITGSILFGSGSDTADIQAGTVNGDIAFGAGANSLSISGGASVTGAITANGGTLALAISNGALQMNNVGQVNLSSLNLGGQSSLTFTIDPATGTSTSLQVAGAATIADGAKIGLRFTSLLQGSATYTLIQANQLTAGAINTTLLGQVPYIYKATLSTNAAQGTVTADVALKSAAEVGLSSAVANAYQPALTAVNLQPALMNAILGQSNQAGFLAAFDQLLPNRSSAVFQLAVAQADGVGRALDDRVSTAGGAWIEELNYGVTDKSRDGTPGYNAYGIGLIGGYEAAFSPLAIFGADFGVGSSQIRDVGTADTSNYTVESFNAGVYWRGVFGRLSANARIGAGYLKINSDRVISITNVTAAEFTADANSKSSGTTFTGRLHVAYEAALGSLYLRPQVALDYLSLTEAGYTEAGGGAGVDLAVQGATSSRSSAFAGLAIGKSFGTEDASWGPELLVGYRDVMTEKLADTTAQFVSGGSQFTIPAATIAGGGFAARVALKGENGYGGFAVEGGAESRDGLNIYDVRLTAHFQF